MSQLNVCHSSAYFLYMKYYDEGHIYLYTSYIVAHCLIPVIHLES